jgi:branched-chain amino acid transport system permease protein
VQRYPRIGFLELAWDVGGVRVQLLQILIFVISVLLMLGVAFVLKHTSLGRAVRTVAFNENVARIVGVPVGRTIFLTFFLSGALAGAAGMLLGTLYNVVSPFMGEQMLVKGLIVIILGGLGNVPGAVAAGFLLGVIEVFSVGYLSSSFRDAIGFTLIFLILLIKPTGLASTFQGRRA